MMQKFNVIGTRVGKDICLNVNPGLGRLLRPIADSCVLLEKEYYHISIPLVEVCM